MMLCKCYTHYVRKIGKLGSHHRTAKCQFSFQSQRRAMPKNVQTITQLPSFHMLSKLMLKILQARLQQYVNWELPNVKTGFRESRWTSNPTADIHWIIEKAREFQKKHLLLLLWLWLSLWLCGSQQTENSERDGNTRPPYLSLRNLYAGQEAKETKRTVRTRHGKMDWFQIGKGVPQGCILSPCLFNVYAEYIMGNARLVEAQTGIKTAMWNINNLI